MSYITANKSLNSRMADERGSLNRRRRSSILPDDLIAGGNNHNNGGMLFDIPPRERQARFEEWIKLSTDNKINTSNSWGVALIDYFHDMEVFRDGDGINFQKLSTTLDGCVKIYSSRIDSVITETGKLLSGLATKKEGEEDDEGEDEEEENEEEGENNGEEVDGKKDGKKVQKKSDSTLKRWKDIKMKSLDQELSIDPLFKKTLAEFDEGGAKSLLMHMLTVDKDVRVMFDTSTGTANIKSEEEHSLNTAKSDRKMKISSLKTNFFNSGEDKFSDDIEICPSLNQLEDVVGDIEKAKTVLKDINYDSSYNMSISGPGNNNDSIGSLTHATQAVLFNDDFDNDNFGGADDIEDDFDDYNNNENNDGIDKEASGIFANTTRDNGDDTELDNQVLNYFDQQLKSNWIGPVHWKVKALKRNLESLKETNDDQEQSLNGVENKLSQQSKKNKKEEFKLDFFNTDDIDDEDIFRVYKNSKINMVMREATDFNLLPDDTFFSSKNLIRLFTKEEQTLKLFKTKRSVVSEHIVPQEELADEKFWADNFEEGGGPTGDFEPDQDQGGFDDDAGVADDDDDDDDDDGDVPETMDFGTQLLANQKSKNRRTVNFARVAKRVDLIGLKNNIWKSIEKQKEEVLEFKEVVRSTVKVYPSEEKKDLSTSFEFIALLHLANEKGFIIESNDDYSNLFIKLSNN